MEDKPSTTPAPSSESKPEETPAKRERRYYKGRKDRPIYTYEEWCDPNFVFPYPPEPEWIEEWKRRHPEDKDV